MNNEKWNEWFAGLTDGDGCFYINKKEQSVSFELTTHVSDSRVVYDIKNKLKFGSVKMRSNCQAIRYRVKAKPAILDIVSRLNGKLYNPVRVQQLIQVCTLYEIQYVPSLPFPELSYAYLAGIIDSDGTISISTSKSSAQHSQLSGVHGKITRLINAKGSNQIALKVTTIYEDYAKFIRNVAGFGTIYVEKPRKPFRTLDENTKSDKVQCNIKNRNTKYHWTIRSQEDFQSLYNQCRLKSVKMHRIRLALLYFQYKDLGYHLKPAETLEAKIWGKFAKSWYKYSY
uniref:Putative LAGLIDADG homing endonuclease n=1 Tax=Carteria sp. SAG 8-5 TaxID=1756294 RepID=A0A0S2LPR2_9CHLO|nr:putative LAGLIDADG homing endonuclease [Carteria sp. SAG 8-5]